MEATRKLEPRLFETQNKTLPLFRSRVPERSWRLCGDQGSVRGAGAAEDVHRGRVRHHHPLQHSTAAHRELYSCQRNIAKNIERRLLLGAGAFSLLEVPTSAVTPEV